MEWEVVPKNIILLSHHKLEGIPSLAPRQISSLPAQARTPTTTPPSRITYEAYCPSVMDSRGETPSNITATAAHQVLSTPELLENVLCRLSFHDLLVNAPRVNRTWSAIVNSSPSIQKTLFFLPAFDQILPQPCPVLRYSSETRFVDRRVRDWDTDATKQGRRILRDEWADVSGFKPYNRNIASKARKEAAGRQDASWRRMLLIQPPIKEGHVDSGQGWILSEDWLRMSDLRNYQADEIVTCRHIAINKDGNGDFRIQFFPHK